MKKLIVLLLFFVEAVFPSCKLGDDAGFMGIFGRIYIREHECSGVDFQELRNWISGSSSADGLYYIKDSNIGSIKTELVPNNRAHQIITVSCVNCQIKEIEKEGLKKLVKLYNLTLVGNSLGEFDGTYIKNDNLRFQHLNLTNNGLNKVENLCVGMPTMKTIVLRDNPIEGVAENIFKSCGNLIYLDLSNTSIKLTKQMLQNNSRLDELHLSRNHIAQMDELYLIIPNLTYLDVSHNELKTLNTELFDYLKQLKILDLSNNQISAIAYSKSTPQSSFPLRKLNLGSNRLKNITVLNMEYFKELQTLDLSNNELQIIPVHFFEHSADLLHLILAHNHLKKLPIGTFSPSPNLIHLDLSYNNFSAFDEELLHSLTGLVELEISGNNLTSFEPYMLGSMTSTLKRLGISDLNMTCDTVSYLVRFCKAHSMDCLPKSGPNFKSSNIGGITCQDTKGTTSNVIRYVGVEHYLNLTSLNLLEQNRLIRFNLDKVGNLNTTLVFLTILAMIFILLKVILPIALGYYGRFRNKREALSSNHLNVSHMELVQDSVYA